MSQMQEKVAIPMNSLDQTQTPKAPEYSSSYTPPYNPESYEPPKSYAPPEPYLPLEPYGPPELSTTDRYLPEPFVPDPYCPSGCCASGDTCHCSSPPPYTCIEVSCDMVGPVNMDSNPPVVVAGIFSSKPASTICPCCRQIITTEIVYRVGSLTYISCTAMCVLGCCLGCCLIPFLTNCCKDVDHYCPRCRYHIYRYKKL